MFDFENYCDDSGTHKESPAAVAACYFSSKSQWDQFVRNWDRVRETEGFDYFQMAEFTAPASQGHAPFCRWTSEKKIRVYEKLTSIINTRAQKGFAVGIPRAAFDSAAPKEFRDRYAADHYTYAVLCCIGLIAQYRALRKIEKPIGYVFDQGSPEGQIRAVWNLLANEPEYAQRFGLAQNGCVFQDKKIFKPLQAADILAWQVRNHMVRVILPGKDDVEMCHPGFRVLREGRYPVLGFFTEAQMHKAFTDLAEYEQRYGKMGPLSVVVPKLV